MSRRVVLVMPDPPLPFGDAAGRWYYVLLKGLVERGHRVTAFAGRPRPGDDDQARALFQGDGYDLRTFPPEPRGGLASKWRSFREPFSFTFSDAFRRDLAATLARGFDVLHLEQLWSGWVGLEHREASVLNVHYLYRIDLMESRSMSPGLRLRTLQAERRLLRAYPNLTTLTPRLSEVVGRINPGARVETIPLGLDHSLYPFGTDPGPRPPTVGLIGSFGWRPSFLAAERLLTRLWPEIHRRVPEARVLVVGRQARSALAPFLETPGLEIAQDVPETNPYFRRIDALLYAPTRGSGMKVKVLEAFALGTPVVTNLEGVEGLPATDGVEVGLADDDPGLIDRTVALLTDPALRESRRTAARRLVETHCAPATTLDAVEAVHARVASSRGRPRGLSGRPGAVSR